MKTELFEELINTNAKTLFISAPGSGFCSAICEFSKENGLHLESLPLAQFDISDLDGIPSFFNSGEPTTITMSTPTFIQRIWDAHNNGVKSILLLDDILRANTQVLATALTLANDNKTTYHNLPDDCLVVCHATKYNPDNNDISFSSFTHQNWA